MGGLSRLVVAASLFISTGALAFPQRTAFTNSTSSKATQTSISSGSETTPGPSLTRSCGFWLPNEIFLNSWWTQHATFTVATEVDYYVQYNNTLVLANSTSHYNGFTASYTATSGYYSGKVISAVYTDFDMLATMGVLASMQWEFPGVPSTLISLLPSTTDEFTYAETRLHTYSEITTEWGIEATRTKTVVASPTPYAEPILGILNVKYLNESGDVVEAKNYTDLYTEAYTGGVWLDSDVDWPSKVYFDSIPSEFIEWVQRNASVASSFPWLNECTNYVGKRPTGAPTVHIVVSTLTHKTSSIIATRPGNFGGSLPAPSSKTSSKTGAQRTSGASTGIESSSSQSQTTATTAAEHTSTGDVERTSATFVTQTSANDSPRTTEQVSTTSLEQVPFTATRQVSSSGAEQDQTTLVQQPTTPSSITVDNTGSPSVVQPNGQVISSEMFTSPQQAGATTLDSGSTASTAPQRSYASQLPSPGSAQSNEPAESSSLPGTTIAVAPVLTLDSTTITPNPSSEYVIGSQTLAPGGPAITIGETTYSLALSASAMIQNGQTKSLARVISVSVAPQTTSGSSVVTANPSEGFVYASRTISAGGPAITINGKTYSLATSGATTYVLENGITQQATTSQTATPMLTFGTSAVTANVHSVFVIGSQTLEAGGSAIVVGETTYSLTSSGSSTLVVQNGITSALATPQENGASIAVASSAEVHIIASVLASKITAETQTAVSAYVVAGQTLSPGGSAVEVEGTTYSLAPSATAILVNGVPSSLPLAPTSPVVSVNTNAVMPAITLDSSVITQNAVSEYVVAGQTLSPGGSAIEVQGTKYSLAPSGTVLLINGASSSVSAAESTGQSSSLPNPTRDDTSPSPVPKGTGAAVLSGLQRTRRTSDSISVTASATKGVQSADATKTKNVVSTSSSAAAAQRLGQGNVIGGTVVAVGLGVLGMVVL
ncbi:hypothetical protein QM012_000197 [Aureobasidium pullulans]|uniref:Uncharacterized protein n=1 Tax=Aureobasidium pullulans TaxID=5580 RepID=A0ABR0TV05_AURPU